MDIINKRINHDISSNIEIFLKVDFHLRNCSRKADFSSSGTNYAVNQFLLIYIIEICFARRNFCYRKSTLKCLISRQRNSWRETVCTNCRWLHVDDFIEFSNSQNPYQILSNYQAILDLAIFKADLSSKALMKKYCPKYMEKYCAV